MPALGNLDAGTAFTAGGRGHARLAVQAAREDAGDRGLAHAARPGEQVGMMQTIPAQGIGQGPHHMRLPDQVLETTGTPLAGQNLVTHASPVSAVFRGPACGAITAGIGAAGKRVVARTRHTPAPNAAATVAPFRAWRDSQPVVARGLIRTTITRSSNRGELESGWQASGFGRVTSSIHNS